MSFFSLITNLFSVLILFVNFSIGKLVEPPKISVEKVNNSFTVLDPLDGLILVARDKVKGVKITCKANCPVQWFLRNYNYDSFPDELADNIIFKARREYKNYSNKFTYKFISEITLKGTLNKLTGRYDCSCVDQQNIKNKNASIYIYWEGSAGQFLLQAGENRKIQLSQNATSFRILCGVSKPEEKVFLFHNLRRLKPNNSTIKQDREGFDLAASLLNKDDDDEFICSTDSNPEGLHNSNIARYTIDFNQTKLISVQLNHFYNLTKESKGLVNFDYDKNILICCSEPGKHRHRQVGYYCRNHQQCQFSAYRLQWGHNAEGKNESCTWYDEGFDLGDGAVVFRCEREDSDTQIFQASAEKFYGFDSKSYHSLNEAMKEMSNFVYTFMENSTQDYYLGSSLTFGCDFSSYLFTEGVAWMLEESGKLLEIGKVSNLYKVERTWPQGNNRMFLKIKLYSMKITRVVCLAPLWNSYDWWNSSAEIHLKKSSSPKFNGMLEENIEQNLGEFVTLNCTASGFPQPKIFWQKDSKEIENGTEFFILNMNSSIISDHNETLKLPGNVTVNSILSFQMQKHSSGNYICASKNVVGQNQKLFVVKQNDKTVTTVVVSTLVLVTILLIILGLSLNKISQQKKAIQFLTRKEIDEFEKGNPEALARIKSTNDYNTNNAHHLLPYNTGFEVPRENLYVDFGQILGTGTYGMVLKGRLKENGIERVVAVKTIKPNEDVSHFKVLLCEVKIMAYIGSHENIAGLVGAFTRNIRNRELLVATEFCENGSLQDLLRKSRPNFQNLYPSTKRRKQKEQILPKAQLIIDGAEYANTMCPRLSTLNLLKWAADIATGMEYLGEKRVIHGDLACRNVLIGSDFKAKVGDFGLSKHLFQYSTYQKKTVQLLPWRYMALESLRDMEFSLQSDIWAYGVTLWEIFTLSETPYPGMTWDQEFMRKLMADFRLEKPKYSTTEIYELILSCWIANPSKRPAFAYLKEAFKELAKEFHSQDAEYSNLHS